MSKLIRHTQKRGTALFVALQLTALIVLSLICFVDSPRQSPNKDVALASSQSQISKDADATQTAQTSTAPMSRDALRRSAHFATKLYEPLNTQVFTLATSRAAQAHNTDLPNDATLTTDREDYPPFSYVYFHGSGFQPGETVDLLVVETDPIQQSFEPWTVVADENGELDTSWYVYPSDFNGASFLATATGETSQLTASVTFTDAIGNGNMQVSPSTAVPSSTGNSFTFNFRSPNATFAASSYVTVVVPVGWTAPQTTNSGNPGFVSATPAPGSTGVTVASTAVTGTGPWTVTVTFQLTTAGDLNGFDLIYAGGGTKVTAPSTAGFHAFTAGSHNGAGGGSSPIDSSPNILVTSSTTNIFQRGGSANANSVSSGTTLAIAKPIGVVANDIMIVNIQTKSATGTCPSNVCPSPFVSSTDWTEIAEQNFEQGGANHRTALLYRVADGTDAAVTSYTFTLDTATQGAKGDIAAFANVSTTSPFDATPCNYTFTTSNSGFSGVSCPGGTPNPSGNGITTVSANAAILMFGAASENNGIFGCLTGSPGNLVLREIYGDIGDPNGTAFGAWVIKATAGSTGPGAGTIGHQDRWAAILIALKPAPVASPTPTATATFTPTATATFTPTATATLTPTATATFTPTATATFTPTATATSTPTATATAATISGTITIKGGAELNSGSVNTATRVTGWLNGSGALPTVVSRSGSFTSVSVGATVTMAAPWNFNSGPLPALWSVGAFTFNLTASTITQQGNGFLAVSGTGTIMGNGFAPTPGSWKFSTQNPPANNVFSFSASTTASPP